MAGAVEGIRVAWPNNWNDLVATFSRLDDPAVAPLGYSGVAPNNARIITGWTLDRGRNYETNQTQTGTATITGIDTTGVLDPSNAGGPYFPNIGQMRQAKIGVQNPSNLVPGSVGYYTDVFTGFIQSIVYSKEPSVPSPTMTLFTINLVDLFDLLSNAEMPLTTSQYSIYHAQFVNDRFMQLLTDGGVPGSGAYYTPGWRNIYSGNTWCQQVNYAPESTIQQGLQDAADAELPEVANVFVGKGGEVRFMGRVGYFNPAALAGAAQAPKVAWVCGDEPYAETNDRFGNPVARIKDIGWGPDQTQLVNAALIYPQNSSVPQQLGQLVVNQRSINANGNRTLEVDNIVVGGGAADGRTALQEAFAYAQFFATNYATNWIGTSAFPVPNVPATPIQRIQKLLFGTVKVTDSSTWNLIFGVEIGDVIIVNLTNPGGGGFFAYPCIVQGIHYQTKVLVGQTPDITLTLDVTPRFRYWFFPTITLWNATTNTFAGANGAVPALPGDQVAASSGFGFQPGVTVSAALYSRAGVFLTALSLTGTTTTAPDGFGSSGLIGGVTPPAFTVPSETPGFYLVRVTDGTNVAQGLLQIT